MTKREIVMKIAEETNIKQIDVRKVVQQTLDIIAESVINGNKVELRNFGVFKLKQRKPKLGRNPRTGVAVQVPARKVAIFKAGLIFKKRLRVLPQA